jgi:hypothetical protein
MASANAAIVARMTFVFMVDPSTRACTGVAGGVLQKGRDRAPRWCLSEASPRPQVGEPV